MKVKEFIDMSIDTRVTVRDNTTKNGLKNQKIITIRKLFRSTVKLINSEILELCELRS